MKDNKAVQAEINSIAHLPHVLIVGLNKGDRKPKAGMKLDLSKEANFKGKQLQDMFSALFILAATVVLQSGGSIQDAKDVLVEQLNDAINRASKAIQINTDTTIH
jgi:histidinol phosphatase-like enzyme